MAEGAYGKMGIARLYCLIFGIAYLAVAGLEAITQDALMDAIGLEFEPMQNAIHWAVGVVTLLAFFGSENTARIVARAVGFVFLAITIWGMASPSSIGEFLGYDHNLPPIYNIVHFLTALAALFAGFASRKAPAEASPPEAA